MERKENSENKTCRIKFEIVVWILHLLMSDRTVLNVNMHDPIQDITKFSAILHMTICFAASSLPNIELFDIILPMCAVYFVFVRFGHHAY